MGEHASDFFFGRIVIFPHIRILRHGGSGGDMPEEQDDYGKLNYYHLTGSS